MPMSSTPRNATPAPMASQRGIPSPRNNPAPSAMRIGPMLTIMAVVPASSVCSARFRATLYAAEPTDAVDHEPHPVAAGRPDPAALHGDQDAESQHADEQASQRKGSAADLRRDTPDHHERARPGEHGERDRPEQQDPQTRFVRCRCSRRGGHVVTLFPTDDTASGPPRTLWHDLLPPFQALTESRHFTSARTGREFVVRLDRDLEQSEARARTSRSRSVGRCRGVGCIRWTVRPRRDHGRSRRSVPGRR